MALSEADKERLSKRYHRGLERLREGEDPEELAAALRSELSPEEMAYVTALSSQAAASARERLAQAEERLAQLRAEDDEDR
jgi:hypothetical protein